MPICTLLALSLLLGVSGLALGILLRACIAEKHLSLHMV